jgi:hypothetical protein
LGDGSVIPLLGHPEIPIKQPAAMAANTPRPNLRQRMFKEVRRDPATPVSSSTFATIHVRVVVGLVILSSLHCHREATLHEHKPRCSFGLDIYRGLDSSQNYNAPVVLFNLDRLCKAQWFCECDDLLYKRRNYYR